MPAPYCHPIDVLRRFDPSLALADLGPNNPYGLQSAEQIQARIRSVSQEWDRDTGTALRLRREGSPDAPSTYDVDLDNQDIVPIDAAAGDVLEVRTGRDSWDDITDAEGDDWTLINETGELKLYQLLVRRIYWEAPDERYLRATYRYGTLGGDRDRGGETALSSQVDSTTTSLSVADASRLPAEGGIVFLPASTPADGEYVRVTDIDHGTDTLTVTRGVNGTDTVQHPSGTTVHYCPEDVRDAAAAQAAAELVRYDTTTQRTDADNAAVSPGQKLDDWQQEWQQTKARYSAVRKM